MEGWVLSSLRYFFSLLRISSQAVGNALVVATFVSASPSIATVPVARRVFDTLVRTRLAISASISLSPVRIPAIPSLTAVPAAVVLRLTPLACEPSSFALVVGPLLNHIHDRTLQNVCD